MYCLQWSGQLSDGGQWNAHNPTIKAISIIIPCTHMCSKGKSDPFVAVCLFVCGDKTSSLTKLGMIAAFLGNAWDTNAK